MDDTTDEGLFSIGSHRLFLKLRGIVRTPGEPLVVFLVGAGDVAASYCAVERLISGFTSLVLYDRSGLGRSDDGPQPPSAATAAEELHRLLTVASLHPPLLLVGHSYGGIIAREYLHAYPESVAGMVLADASTERQPELFRNPDLDIPAVLGNLRFAQVTGLRDAARLSRDEWRTRAAHIARGYTTERAEGLAFAEVCQSLARKNQYQSQSLGERPLSVICCRGVDDYRRIYEAGIRAGNGTEPQRVAFHDLLERWETIGDELQRDQLQLSSVHRYVSLPDCGHHIHLIRPDVLAQEIQWVKERIEMGQEKGKI
ncbi:Alpha/Beta hydrolase protein [Aspergillus taichungensis]|uniref:Alpha/Beta hydrolase protein n=1 Tax=Aspergillus taichungensis TaxID=482145 RepID=A0A2J5I235_9EURO|nr:Alpha/Beta hydrolase protein [Aspergillus taichungensis]